MILVLLGLWNTFFFLLFRNFAFVGFSDKPIRGLRELILCDAVRLFSILWVCEILVCNLVLPGVV